MKKLAIAFAALLILAAFVGWNVWHAVYEPVTTPPSLVEQGRQQLHTQLEQAKNHEAAIEQQDWGSITLLRQLIQAHQQRIDQLNGNSQAGEILAHDRDAIARLEKRIADLQAQQAALPPTPTGENATAAQHSEPAQSIANPSVTAPAAHPSSRPATATQTARPAPKNPAAPTSSATAPRTQSTPPTPKPAQQQPPPQTR